MQYIAKGSNGVTVPVIITADMVQKSFKNNSATHAKLKEIAKAHLSEFYKEQVVWKLICKDGKALRREAAATLGDDAPAFGRLPGARQTQGPENRRQGPMEPRRRGRGGGGIAMDHQETCRFLDTALRIAWWPVSAAMLIALAYFGIALTRIGK